MRNTDPRRESRCASRAGDDGGVGGRTEVHGDDSRREANTAVTFIGVAALSDAPAMREFVTRYGIGSFTNLADTDASVWQRFGVTSQPAYAFIHPNGTVDTVKGSLSEDELASRVHQLAGS